MQKQCSLKSHLSTFTFDSIACPLTFFITDGKWNREQSAFVFLQNLAQHFLAELLFSVVGFVYEWSCWKISWAKRSFFEYLPWSNESNFRLSIRKSPFKGLLKLILVTFCFVGYSSRSPSSMLSLMLFNCLQCQQQSHLRLALKPPRLSVQPWPPLLQLSPSYRRTIIVSFSAHKQCPTVGFKNTFVCKEVHFVTFILYFSCTCHNIAKHNKYLTSAVLVRYRPFYVRPVCQPKIAVASQNELHVAKYPCRFSVS